MLGAVVLLAWVYLVLFHGRFWRSGPELAAVVPSRAPDVAIVVPARNEAEVIAATIQSLLAQDYPGRFRVVLVDDRSEDGTGAIAAAVPGAEIVTVISGEARPAGWAGKPWAMHQGVLATSEEFVLLTDADIVHAPRHLATLVAKAQAENLDLVSEMVALNCTSAAERALVPAFVYFFQLLFPFSWANERRRKMAAAAGGTMLIRRRALERIGGMAAIADALIDDCALAAKVKPGGAIWLGHSGLARSVRPYPGMGDIWRMITRSAYVQLKRSPLLLLGSILGLALIYLAPPALALFGEGWERWAGVAAWVLMAVSFQPTLTRYAQSPLWGLALPWIALFYMAATVASAVDHHRGRGVVWKNRAYADGAS